MRKALMKTQVKRIKRAMRNRKKLKGTSLKPRMSVNKTNKHINVQLIDDESGKTIGSIGTYAKEFKDTDFNRKNKASAKKLGEQIAAIAKEHNIKEIVFDRGPFKYHGILAELANAAREGGLQF